MGIPTNSIKQLEENVRYGRKSWIMIIFANAASDSKAVEYVIRNFHEMDVISDDVDFYLPGYDVLEGTIGARRERDELEQMKKVCYKEDQDVDKKYQDYHREDSFRYGVLAAVKDKRDFWKVIDSPRLGQILFHEARFTDFIMELHRKNCGYRYMGTCQMNIVPLIDSHVDYKLIRSYDLDAIIDCPSGPSLDSFFHHVVHVIRNSRPRWTLFGHLLNRRDDVLVKIDRLYEEATMFRGNYDRYEIIINNVIVDMERCLQWSLREEYFFISYSSKNVLKAAMIGRLLQEKGKHVWIAPDGIPQGREYSLVVPTALKLAKHFVLLLTPEAAQSNWVKRELDIAISNEANTKVKVLLADGYSIDDIRRDNELLFYLNKVQIKYVYEDVIRDSVALERFILE
ncbi:MAG: toll/interleukin-1 receptor domain-containing protein [Prevotella sp.]|nr:toll/interleukin-1 receptor domain-containing protein [Prevotella sp.]